MAEAAEEHLNVVISVIDRATAGIRAINERIGAIAAPVRRIGGALGELAEESGIRGIGEHATEALEHVRRLHETLSDVLAPIAALTAGFSVAGLAELVKGTAEYAEQLELTSKASGLSTAQLGGWHYAAQLANISQERLSRGLQYFNRTIAEASRGKAADAELIFSRLGFANVPGHLVGTSEGLRAVSAEAKQLVDSGQVQLASDMMAKLFGERVGAGLLPLFAQGPEHLQELFDAAAKHGQALTEEQTKAGAAFMEQYKEMASAVEGLRYAIAEDLFPTLTPVIARMTDWIDVNREWISSNIGTAVQQIVSGLRSIDWAGIGGQLRAVGQWAGWAVHMVGGLGPAIAIVASIKLAPAILAFGQLGLAAVRSAAVIAAAAARGSMALFGIGTAGRLVAGAGWIGAVGLAAYEVYRHWDTIEPQLEVILRRLSPVARQVGDDILHALEDGVLAAWDKWREFGDWVNSQVTSPFWRHILGLQDNLSGGAPSSGPTGPLPPGPAAAPLPAERAELAQRLFAEAQHRGLDREHALALLGNTYAESGLNPEARGDYENGIPTSFGLFQWHNERAAALRAALGGRWLDPAAQLDYAIDEMRRRNPEWFSRSGSAGDLTNQFERDFERPAHLVDRSGFTDKVAAALGRPLLSRATPEPAAAKAAHHQVTVKFANTPPGTQIRHDERSAGDLDLDLGQAFAW